MHKHPAALNMNQLNTASMTFQAYSRRCLCVLFESGDLTFFLFDELNDFLSLYLT